MDSLGLTINEILEDTMIERRSFLDALDRIYNDCWLIIKYQKVLRILKPGQLAGMSSMLREVVEVLEKLADGVEEEGKSSSTPIDISQFVEDVGEQNDKPHP
jgi:hypothetical protein